MKRLTIFILFMLIIASGYSQKYTPGVLIGKKYRQVETLISHHKSYRLLVKNDSTLTYYNWKEDIEISYLFVKIQGKRYCYASSITLDCLSGEELIGAHSLDWEFVGNSKWLYHTPNYDVPLTVTLSFNDEDKMEFTYVYSREY